MFENQRKKRTEKKKELKEKRKLEESYINGNCKNKRKHID